MANRIADPWLKEAQGPQAEVDPWLEAADETIATPVDVSQKLYEVLTGDQDWTVLAKTEDMDSLRNALQNWDEVDEAGKRAANALYYADVFDIDPNMAFSHQDLATEVFFGEPLDSAKAFDRILKKERGNRDWVTELQEKEEREYAIQIEAGLVPNPMYEVIRDRENQEQWVTGNDLWKQMPSYDVAKARHWTQAETAEQWEVEKAELWYEAFKMGPEGFRVLAGLLERGYQRGVSFGELAAMDEVRLTDLLPFAGSAIRAIQLYGIYQSTKRLKEHGLEDYEERVADERAVLNYLSNQYELSERGTTFGAKWGRGVIQLPAFMGEFIATGGLANIGKRAVGKTGLKALDWVTKTAAGAVMRTIANPQRIAESYFRQRLGSVEAQRTERGKLLVKEFKETPFVSGLKAFGDVWVEMFTEETGEVLTKPFSWLAKKVPILNRLQSAWTARMGGGLDVLLTKAGFHGITGEVLEERLGEVMRAAMGIQPYEAPTGQQVLAELLTFAIPGAIRAGARFIPSETLTPKVSPEALSGLHERIRSMTDAGMTKQQIDEMLAPPEKAPEPVVPEGKITEVPVEEVVPVPEEVKAEPEEVARIVPTEKEIEAVESAQPPTIQEEIERGPRYAVAEDGKTVIDWQTQQEVATYETKERAQREANALNAGEVTPKAERRAALLPVEEGKTYTTRQLLNITMQAQSKAARASYMEGARAVVATQTDLARYASEHLTGLAVTEAQRKQLIGAVAKTRTPAEKITAIATIHRLAEKARHVEAVAALRKTTAYINRQAKLKKKDKGIRPEYLDKIRSLTDTFVFQAPTAKTKQRLASLKDYIDRMREAETSKYGQEVAEMLLPSKLMNRLDKIDRKPVAEMSADEVRDINNALQMLVHLNRTKNRLLGERKARDAVETINNVMTELDNVVDRSRVPKDNVLNEDYQNHSLIRRWWSWFATTDNHDPETLVHTISGGQEGALQDNVIESLSEGRQRRDIYSNEALDYLLQTLKDNNISLIDLQRLSPGFQRFFKTPRKERFKNFFRAIIGKPAITPRYAVKLAGKTKQLTMDEMMDVYMHAQAIYNLDSMVNEGIASYQSEIGVLSVEEIEAIASQVEANPNAMVLIGAAQHHYENIAKPAINRTSLQLIGQPLAEEPNYWHIERFKKRGLFGAEAYSISTLESEGRLQSRVGSNRPIIIRGFVSKLLNDISATAEYVGMAPAYRNIKMILNYGEFKNKVDSLGYQKERENLSTILQRTESPSYEHGSLDKVIMGLLRGLTRTVLAGPNIMFGQYVSVHGYFDEMSTKYRTAGLLRPPTNAEIARLEKNWPFLKTRRRGGISSIALQDIAQTDMALRALGGKTDVANIVTSGIHAVDIRAIATGGQLVEAEMADSQRDGKSKQYWDRQDVEPSQLEKDSPEYWDTFRKRARFVVRRTQPMFDGENRSVHTSEKKPTHKMWFLFRSYIDQPLRMAYRANTERANDRIKKIELSRRWANVMVTVMSYAVVGWLTDKLIYRSDKDWKDLIFDMLSTPLKMLTVIGFPLRVLLKRTIDIRREKRPSWYKPRFDNVAIGFMNKVAEGASMIAEGLGYLGSGQRYKSGPNKGKLKSVRLISKGLFYQFENVMAFYGIPAHIVRRSIKGWTEEQEDKKKSRPVSTIKRR